MVLDASSVVNLTAVTMPEYSFPMLKPREIVEILGELGIAMTEEELSNPAGWKVKTIYEQVIELRLNLRREDMAQHAFDAVDHLEFPELHEESVPTLAFFKAW